MQTKKYAVDLLTEDCIIPKHDTREVFVEWIETDLYREDQLRVIGYFIDDGESFDRWYDHDSVVTVL